jgi:hypothetical protein
MSDTYVITWTEENWYDVYISADSEEQAIEKFENKDFDPKTGALIEKIHIHQIKKID